MYRANFWTLWEKARVGWSERTALKHVYYQVWNRSPVQVGCMRQVLRAGALGRPRGMGWGGRREAGSGWGTRVNPWVIHVNVWQKPPQYCKVVSLQLIKINGEKKVDYIIVLPCEETYKALFFFKTFLMWTNFESLYWICYNTTSVLYFGFFGYKACGILAPWPGIEFAPSVLNG